MSCKINDFFNESQNGVSIAVSLLTLKSETDVNKIYSAVKSKISDTVITDPSSVSPDQIAQYNESISSLVQFLGQKLDEYISNGNIVAAELKQRINDNLKNDFHANIQIEQDEESVPYMENNEDMSEETAENKNTIDIIIEDFYGNIRTANVFRISQLERDLVKSTILNGNKRVRTSQELNIAICDLKNEYFKRIYNYLKEVNPNLQITDVMFNEDYELVSDWSKVMSMFYRQVLNLKNNNELEEKVQEGWSRELLGSTDTFYSALNAYVNLFYFDTNLELELGKTISINKAQKGKEFNGDTYKYKFAIDDTTRRKSFQNSEDRDATKDLGKWSKLVLNTIPINRGVINSNKYVSTSDFMTAVAQLFEVALTLDINNPLRQAVLTFHRFTYANAVEIFNILLGTTERDQKIVSDLKLNGLNKYNFEVLLSVAKAAYDKSNPNSYYNIEQAEPNTTLPGYSMVEAINGVIDRSMQVNYGQYVYDRISGTSKYTEKKKYQDLKNNFDIIRSINNNLIAIDQHSRKALSDKFIVDFDKDSCDSAKVRIGNAQIKVFTKSSNLLSSKSIHIDMDSVPFIFKRLFSKDLNKVIDLSTKTAIDNIINNENLNEYESAFRQLLDIFDSYLLTDFLTVDGLQTMSVMMMQTPEILQKLLDSVVKLAIVNDLNYRFNEALLDTNNTEYKSLLDFPKFLKKEFKSFAQSDFSNITFLKNYGTNEEGIFNLNVSRISDEWIDLFTKARAIINGTISTSVTRDLSRNKIANNRTSFLGGNIYYYLNKYKEQYKDYLDKVFGEFTGKETLPSDEKKRDSEISRILQDPTITAKVISETYSGLKEDGSVDNDIIQIKLIKMALNAGVNATDLTLKTIYEIAKSKGFTNFNKTILQIGQKELYNRLKSLGKSNTSFAGSLLFEDNDIIKRVEINNDASNRMGIVKSVKKMTTPELFYSSIIGNFYDTFYASSYDENRNNPKKNPLINTVLIQPTTYSDKTTFVQYAIDVLAALETPNRSYTGKSIWQLNSDQLIDLYNDTVLQAHKNLYDKVLADYSEVLGRPITIPEINALLAQKGGVQNLARQFFDKGKEFQSNTYYTKINGITTFNPLLQYYAEVLYGNKQELVNKFNKEKINFINDLLDSGVIFNLRYSTDGDQSSNNPVSKLIDEFCKDKNNAYKMDRDEYLKEWTANGRLVLGKVNGQNIGWDHISDPNVQLNPIFEKFFFTDAVLANNLRLELTGTEIAHPSKAKIDIVSELKSVGIDQTTHSQYFTTINGKVSSILNDLTTLKNAAEENPLIKKVYDKVLTQIESLCQLTQLKRNVIIPATLNYTSNGLKNGVPEKVKVAVIEDMEAHIFNFRGDKDSEDAQDGSAYITPMQRILENKSLLDQETGVDRKPIWHHYNPNLGTASLVKFAAFTETAERMQHLGSTSAVYRMFKKQTNIEWEVEVDLTKKKAGEDIDFIQDIAENSPYIYKQGDKYYQILNFGKDEHGYFTIERGYSKLGPTSVNAEYKVYHKFNENSEHLKFRYGIDEEVNSDFGNTHDINTLFELYNALGGIYTVELTENYNREKQFVFNEKASYATVNFMNLVVDQNEKQILKDYHIGYVVNVSAFKNGASNINSRDAWHDNSKLMYMELDSDGLGMQMDADHIIDEAELTEFSQVISALEAGGRLHHMSNRIYKVLGSLALQASQHEIQAVAEYIQAQRSGESLVSVKNKIYDIVGRLIINNYKAIQGRVDLSQSIISELKKTFNFTDDHSNDIFKLPFSDPNMYNQAIVELISTINKKSIKRKYPGSGYVMAPGYNMMMTYKYEGKTGTFEDVLREAKKEIKDQYDESKEDITSYQLRIVREFLQLKQQKEWENATEADSNNIEELTTAISKFIPTDVVDVLDDSGNLLCTITLDEIGEYYRFKGYDGNGYNVNNTISLIKEKTAQQTGRAISARLRFATNVTKPRNLAPARIYWKYNNGTTEISTNIFDTKEVRDSFLHKFETPREKALQRERIQKVFDELDRGEYQGHKVTDLHNEAAEVILSNMYASKFLTQNESIQEILDTGPSYFKKRRANLIPSDYYDFAFTKNNGKHMYVTLSKPINAIEQEWKYKKIIDDKVYATTKDGIVLYQIGILRRLNDVTYNSQTQQYTKTDEWRGHKRTRILNNPNLTNKNGKVYQYVQFVTKYQASETFKDKVKGFNLLYIDTDSIKNPKFVGELLHKLYSLNDYTTIQLNSMMSDASAKRLHALKDSLPTDSSSMMTFFYQSIDKYLINGENTLRPKQIKGSRRKDFSILNQYTKELDDLYDTISKEIYTSFERSLYYVSSRIPAQTLQSFMQMKSVAFSRSTKNVAYVSHWQTW